MTPFLANSIGWTLLHFVWQGALIGCATALALLVLRRAPARQRYSVACLGLLACLAWPALDLATRLRAGPLSQTGARFNPTFMTGTDGSTAGGLLVFLQSNLMLIVGFWALCAALLALRMVLGLLWVRRLGRSYPVDPLWQARATAMAARFGIGRQVQVRVAAHLESPLTAGWWRPVILLPAALVSGMPPELLEALLAHEMAHVKRFDYLVNLGQNLVEIVLFYHPAVWWISNRIRVEREQISDDLAAQALGERRCLAEALSELERMQFSDHHLALAANGGELVTRVRRLLRPETETLNWKAVLPALGLAVACLSVYAQASVSKPTPQVQARTAAVADFKSCGKPLWPAESLAAGHVGAVTLSFQIDSEGKVSDSRLKRSSGHPLLDEAARAGIAKCRFKPGTENGVAVSSWMQMRYVWILN